MGVLFAPFLVYWSRRSGNALWLARRIERKHPELDARLLAALEQHPDAAGDLGFLQQMVIDQAVAHAQKNRWVELVPSGSLRVARLANWAMFAVFAVVALQVGVVWNSQRGRSRWGRWCR